MRLIGSLTERQDAENFTAYLLTEGIHSHLEEEKGDFEIWIKDEDTVESAVLKFEQFQHNSSDPKYSEAVSRAKELQLQEIKKRQRLAKNVVNVSGGQVKRQYPLTISLIAICAIVALLTDFGSSVTKAPFRALAYNAMPKLAGKELLEQNQGDRDALAYRMASVSKGELWRLVTPIFIHFGPIHIVFNMFCLFIFGSQIENRYGPFWYGMLILFAAIVSNLFQCIVPAEIGGSSPTYIGQYMLTLFGGMSGVVYALFGFVLMRMTYEPSSNLFVSAGTVFFLLFWLVFCMIPASKEILGFQVANWAHAIGLLVGIVLGYWPMIVPRKSTRAS